MTQVKPVRDVVAFTEEEYEEFVCGGIGWKIISDEIYDRRRWSVVYEIVIERLEDATFWSGHYEVGATESQHYGWDEKWFDDDDGKATFMQVFPETVTTVIYR